MTDLFVAQLLEQLDIIIDGSLGALSTSRRVCVEPRSRVWEAGLYCFHVVSSCWCIAAFVFALSEMNRAQACVSFCDRKSMRVGHQNMRKTKTIIYCVVGMDS